jgi:hypothetical protein
MKKDVGPDWLLDGLPRRHKFILKHVYRYTKIYMLMSRYVRLGKFLRWITLFPQPNERTTTFDRRMARNELSPLSTEALSSVEQALSSVELGTESRSLSKIVQEQSERGSTYTYPMSQDRREQFIKRHPRSK